MSFPKTYKIAGDIEVNRMGFGAMRITGEGIIGMPADPQNSIDVLQKAQELGVNFIDTADQYGLFTSEKLIAQALSPYPSDLVIATKGGIVRYGPGRSINYDATPQHLHDALDGSLRRLSLSQITLYQLHRIDPKVPPEVTFAFLRSTQEDGRVKHLGLSEVSVDDIKRAQEHFTVASVQNKYSVDDREWEQVLRYCQGQNIAFIPWFPISGGETKGYGILQSVADKYEVTVRQIALSWLLHHADNILLIPGTSNLAHLQENMAAAEIELSEADMERIELINRP